MVGMFRLRYALFHHIAISTQLIQVEGIGGFVQRSAAPASVGQLHLKLHKKFLTAKSSK